MRTMFIVAKFMQHCVKNLLIRKEIPFSFRPSQSKLNLRTSSYVQSHERWIGWTKFRKDSNFPFVLVHNWLDLFCHIVQNFPSPIFSHHLERLDFPYLVKIIQVHMHGFYMGFCLLTNILKRRAEEEEVANEMRQRLIDGMKL
uniref:Uncharacterized protein n=1 Tax=Opuntia streptacantha TaxID=393608 RepID=A0A7C9EKF2_OPUST